MAGRRWQVGGGRWEVGASDGRGAVGERRTREEDGGGGGERVTSRRGCELLSWRCSLVFFWLLVSSCAWISQCARPAAGCRWLVR